jgi:uncharacterized protein (DUF362 family)
VTGVTPAPRRRSKVSRRTFIRGASAGLAVTAVGIVGARALRGDDVAWDEGAFAPPGNPSVAVVRASSYERDLEGLVQDGLEAVGVDPTGRAVVLKPNLVEYDSGASINTDPRLVGATVLAMRRMGARSVTVAEGPGHRRDTDYVVSASGLWDVLVDVEAPFVDLNVAPARPVDLKSSYMGLDQLWLPDVLLDADMVVSMPKMKAHHWVGVTLSMKNCFGCMPGRIYGWPKNVLHWKGIPQSILDIVGAVQPSVVIIDGIVGMEGDGPIKGTPIDAGHLVFGTDPVATDVVAARVMGLDPERIEYLQEAGRYLGQAHWDEIEQVGEDPEATGLSFALIPEFAFLEYGSTAERGEMDSTGG